MNGQTRTQDPSVPMTANAFTMTANTILANLLRCLGLLALTAFASVPAQAQQFRATASIHYGGALTYPASIQNGDLLVLSIISTSAVSGPAGWTEKASYPWTVYGYRSYVFTKVRNGETSVNVPGANGGGVLLAYSNTSGVGSVGSYAESAAATTSLAVPGITPQSAKGRVLGLVTDRDFSTAPTPAAGFTSRSSAATGYFSNSLAEKAFGSTSPTGSQTWTQATGFPAVGLLMELLPRPGAALSASVSPATVISGGTATLTFTLTNPNSTALTNVRFTDALGSVSVANATLGGSCTGVTSTPALTVGATNLDLTVANLPSGSCTVTVQVTSTTVGSHGNTATAPVSTESDLGTPANTATLTVVAQPAPPVVTTKFEPAWMASGGQSTLRILVTSPLNIALTTVNFTGTLAGMTVASTTIGGTCVGVTHSPALTVGATSLNLTVPNLPAGGCSVTVQVTSTAMGSNPATLTGATSAESSGTGPAPPTSYLTVAEDPGFMYVHADHLGTPRAITRPSDNQVVWKWDNTEPFGNNAANENPSGLGTFTYNLRFPGQYADQENGTRYNYFRDYDPVTGRYRQSDPIGLFGGHNTYLYVDANPLDSIDLFGLKREDEGLGRGGGFGFGRATPRFPNLKDHARRHGNGKTDGQYYQDAISNVERGRHFWYRHEGQEKLCYITRAGENNFKFTSVSDNHRVIRTHYEITEQGLKNLGITLPKGF
ncbi:MAG: hypothetical protein JNM76_13150 [Betaproteobacteria bacterium]|nr:hypothetical protein [Betaproteobacteria bacterium]